MARRVGFALILGFAVSAAVLVSGFTAEAAPGDVATGQAKVEGAKQRLAEIQAQVGESYAAYDEAVARLEKLNGEIATTNEDLLKAEKEFVAAQAELEDRAAQVYKSGNVGFLDVLMGSESFSEFARRLDLWVQLLREEQADVERVRAVRDELAQKQATLQQRREARSAAVQQAANRRAEAARLVTEAQGYLNTASGELQAAVKADKLARQVAAQDAAERAAAQEAPQPQMRLVADTRDMELTEAAQRQAERAARRAAKEKAAAERAAAERAAAEREARLAAERAVRQEAKEKAAEKREARLAAARQAAEERRRAELAAQRAEERRIAAEQARAAADLAKQQAAAEKQAAQEAAANELIAAENPVQAGPASGMQPAPEQTAPEQPAPEVQQIEVPNVIGQDVDSAAQTVAGAGLAYATAEAQSDEPAGTVVETDPAAGTPLDPGTVVTLYYSSGPAPAPTTPAPQPEQTTPTTQPQQPAPTTPSPSTGGGSCGDTFGGVQPYVAEVGCAVRAQFGVQTIYGFRPGDPQDHGSGLALDIMTYSDVDLAYQIAAYLKSNWSNFGISYIITQQQIDLGSGWQPMEDRGSPTQNHMDHVHVSFVAR